jgi:hypothetical protein
MNLGHITDTFKIGSVTMFQIEAILYLIHKLLYIIFINFKILIF